MSEVDWTAIPGKLKAAGFTISYDRISYASEHPLWCARASRGERQWTTMGRDLGTAFVELEKQTQDPAVDWREMMVLEKSRPCGEKIPATN